MRADLPTEEDVLAALVLDLAMDEYLESALPVADRLETVRALVSLGAREESWRRLVSLRDDRVVATPGRSWRSKQRGAIADSERRLDCERARDAVVEAADEYSISPDVDHTRILHAAAVLRVARRALLRAEVSRHGG